MNSFPTEVNYLFKIVPGIPISPDEFSELVRTLRSLVGFFSVRRGGVLIAYWGRDIKCQNRGQEHTNIILGAWGGEPKAIPPFSLEDVVRCGMCMCAVCVLGERSHVTST